MSKQVLFVEGGGDEGYEVDKELVNSLQTALGKGYNISYPGIQTDESAPDFGWPQQIGKKIGTMTGEFMLVGHSFGASMIIKYLSENNIDARIKGLFLIATPFWSGNDDWLQGLKLQDDFADKLPKEIPMFFYHCLDDEEIPISHMDHYKQKLADATFRVLEKGGHQFGNDLAVVANDITSLSKR